MGEIVTTHGIAGWLKVNPYNLETTVFSTAREVFLEHQGNRSARELESSRPHGRQFLVKLSGINGIEEASKWVGFDLCVVESTLQPLQPGEYYHYQVIGLEVLDLKGERIGVITHTWSTPGGELYVVRGAEKEHLIPAVKEIVEKVDLAAGTMIINPPPGLLDL
ncbi:MAG: ribosome maturation factor RimM [Deltaproteobacteria bacterium]